MGRHQVANFISDKFKFWSFMSMSLQVTYIYTKFADTQQKLLVDIPQWSTTATRQQLISHYWFTYVAGHFDLLFGLPALVTSKPE